MAAPDGIVEGSVTEDQGLRRSDEIGRALGRQQDARSGERGASARVTIVGEVEGG